MKQYSLHVILPFGDKNFDFWGSIHICYTCVLGQVWGGRLLIWSPELFFLFQCLIQLAGRCRYHRVAYWMIIMSDCIIHYFTSCLTVNAKCSHRERERDHIKTKVINHFCKLENGVPYSGTAQCDISKLYAFHNHLSGEFMVKIRDVWLKINILGSTIMNILLLMRAVMV